MLPLTHGGALSLSHNTSECELKQGSGCRAVDAFLTLDGYFAAKNVILAGVRSVTLHDTEDVKIQDLSAQFYLSKADMGENRAEACRDKLQELNTAVAVCASTAELNEDFLRKFQVYNSPSHEHCSCSATKNGLIAESMDSLCFLPEVLHIQQQHA